ncbi:MAG: hypothetical protein N3A54_04090 [Patescibacteria group bacterium]|nr:hypothetical protein [Patescibacteria group bacterium]
MLHKSIKTAIIFGCLLLAPLKAQWKEFVDQFGKSVPFHLFDPAKDLEVKREFFIKSRTAYEKYLTYILLELNCRNFTIVEIELQNFDKDVLIFYATGKVRRGGLDMKFVVYSPHPFQYSPTQFADIIEKKHEEHVAILSAAPWRIKEEPIANEFEIKSFRELILWEPQKRKCDVVFQLGTACSFDVGSSPIWVKTP